MVSPIFLKRSLVSPILLFSSISLHCSPKKAFFSPLAILWNSAFRSAYLSLSPLPFTSLVFSAICKASSDNQFAFLHFFILGMALAQPLHSFWSYFSALPQWHTGHLQTFKHSLAGLTQPLLGSLLFPLGPGTHKVSFMPSKSLCFP